MIRSNSFARTAIIAALIVGAAIVSPICATAQITAGGPQSGPQLPPPPPIMSVNDPMNPLHLTAAQQKQKIVIVETFVNKLQSMLQNSPSLTAAQKQAKAMSMQKDAVAEFRAILVGAQVPAFDKRQKDQEAYMKGSREAGEMAQSKQKQFFASLKPSQVAQMNALRAKGVSQIAAIEKSTSLTDLQKGEQEQAIRVSVQSQFKKILSPTQSQLVSDEFRYLANQQTLEKLAQESGN